MDKRKQFAGNKLFNACMIAGLLLAWGAIEFFRDNDADLGIGFCIASLLFMVLPAIFTPFCYAFDREGVSLCYLVLPVERYLWKDIRAISVEYETSGANSGFISVFFSVVFRIEGKNVGEYRFYMNGHIRKSLRTKYLLEKYWDGTITGYFFEGTKKWIGKRKAKKQSEIKAHYTDEIVLMEREARAETREWLKPFIAKAKTKHLDVKTKFLYVTKDFKELNSRPKEGYTYTLIAEIACAKETDENHIVVVSVDLLYVRLGKTAYRGVKNECAKEELELTFADALKESNDTASRA